MQKKSIKKSKSNILAYKLKLGVIFWQSKSRPLSSQKLQLFRTNSSDNFFFFEKKKKKILLVENIVCCTYVDGICKPLQYTWAVLDTDPDEKIPGWCWICTGASFDKSRRLTATESTEISVSQSALLRASFGFSKQY